MQFPDFRGLIDQWPSRADFARAVLLDASPKASAMGKVWYRRNRVPKWYFKAVVSACALRGIAMTISELDELFDRGFKEGY